MSHSTERKEKNCLNCNARVEGRYCQVCGQENIETKESIWHVVTHFFNDITHYDGKFLNSVRFLLWKPGFLSYEYMRGRRASYLHPIRMYVFTSAFFFLIFFSFFKPGEKLFRKEEKRDYPELIKKYREAQANLTRRLPTEADSVRKKALMIALAKVNDSLHRIETAYDQQREAAEAKRRKDSIEEAVIIDTIQQVSYRYNGKLRKDTVDPDVPKGLTISAGEDNEDRKVERFTSAIAYDAYQDALPAAKQDSYIEKGIMKGVLKSNEKEGSKNREMLTSEVLDKYFHKFPQMLFVSLPIFALILQLLYLRRRKYFYTDHAIFTIHFYCASFLLMLLLYGFNALNERLHWGFLDFLQVLIGIYMFIYLYKAMRTFYQQSRTKTIVKFLLLNIVSAIVFIFLMTGFLLYSVMNVK